MLFNFMHFTILYLSVVCCNAFMYEFYVSELKLIKHKKSNVCVCL